ncbi:MAG: ribonuclease HI [Clostridia bacterium]|nr:ribonuclease HI [Clostridia bacterium]
MKKVIIYTDGACSYNPGPGGWGCVLIYKDIQKSFSGFDKNTTNNQMEMQAVIEALKKLSEPCEVDLYSDSAYVVNAFNAGWLDNWKKNNWRTAQHKPVKNDDMWKEMDRLVNMHSVVFHKVKGHSDVELNNLCDSLARGEVDRFLATNPDYKLPKQEG